MTKYRLEMNEEQARCVVDALDLAMRVLLGQWREMNAATKKRLEENKVNHEKIGWREMVFRRADDGRKDED